MVKRTILNQCGTIMSVTFRGLKMNCSFCVFIITMVYKSGPVIYWWLSSQIWWASIIFAGENITVRRMTIFRRNEKLLMIGRWSSDHHSASYFLLTPLGILPVKTYWFECYTDLNTTKILRFSITRISFCLIEKLFFISKQVK